MRTVHILLSCATATVEAVGAHHASHLSAMHVVVITFIIVIVVVVVVISGGFKGLIRCVRI